MCTVTKLQQDEATCLFMLVVVVMMYLCVLSSRHNSLNNIVIYTHMKHVIFFKDRSEADLSLRRDLKGKMKHKQVAFRESSLLRCFRQYDDRFKRHKGISTGGM